MVSRCSSRLLASAAICGALSGASAVGCAGAAPHWCSSWKLNNEPFYNCSGSETLSDQHCAAWQEFFDAAGGASWKDCSDSRSDPCSCHGKPDVSSFDETGRKLVQTKAEPNGGIVYCKGDHIYSIDLQGNRLTGNLTGALSRMEGLRLLNIGDNQLVGPLPSFPASLTALDVGGNKKPSGVHGLTGSIPDLSVRQRRHRQQQTASSEQRTQ